jgi:hypothetical protein
LGRGVRGRCQRHLAIFFFGCGRYIEYEERRQRKDYQRVCEYRDDIAAQN